MTGCSGKAAACRGGPVRPFTDPIDRRRAVTLMCVECATSLNASGTGFVETDRRVTDIPVAVDRRPFMPAWRRNLLAKDMTGARR
jgi:hypothetical protein